MRRKTLILVLGVAALLVSPAAAQTITQITKTASGLYDQYPVVSADGQMFAWSGNDPATRLRQVWVADMKSLTPRMITNGAGHPIPYPMGISGDGTLVVYMESGNIWTVPTAGGAAKQVTSFPSGRSVRTSGISVSHDGRLACYVVYDSNATLYDIEVVDTSTGQITNITKATTSDSCTGGISGDGRLVAFSAKRTTSAGQIWLANADGTNIRALTTFATGSSQYPQLDHLGKICSFQSNVSGDNEIYTIYTDGTGLSNVSNNPGGDDRRAWLAADGDRVSWKSTRGSGSDVYMAYPDGTGLRQLTPFGNMSPSLTNSSHCLNGDGTVALFGSSFDYQGGNPEKDYEVYLWRDALTRAGSASPGSTVVLNMEDQSRAGEIYLVRCAFSRSPGIPIQGQVVPLTPDDLFWLSGLAPAIFQNFLGVLNAQGLGAAAVAIPNVPALIGIGIYSSFITVDAQTQVKVYNPVLSVIR